MTSKSIKKAEKTEKSRKWKDNKIEEARTSIVTEDVRLKEIEGMHSIRTRCTIRGTKLFIEIVSKLCLVQVKN